jgi:hypothetical protein
MIRPLLLHLANSDPPFLRIEFYALKTRLLRKHGTRDGADVQEIIKPCYGKFGNEYGEYLGCVKERDCRCGGTGIFSRRVYGLERWRWGRFIFHVPIDTLPGPLITIRGRIEHRRYGILAREASFWLYLLCGEFGLFFHSLRAGSYCAWKPLPMLILNNLVCAIARKLARHTCIYCRRRFFTGDSGWCVCCRCRQEQDARHREIDAEIPF